MALRDWDAATAPAASPFMSWHGQAWRTHDGVYKADSYGGSLRFSARFHRAPDEFPPNRTWPALYLSLAAEVAVGEALRYMLLQSSILAVRDRIRNYRLSELQVTLAAVLDCRDLSALGLTRKALLGESYALGQELAAAAVARGAEGIIVPSATRWGDNLIVFPHNQRPGSQIVVKGYRIMKYLLSKDEAVDDE